MAGLMVTSSLRRRLTAEERTEPGFSSPVARDLLEAVRYLAASGARADAYLKAHELAWKNLDQPMSRRQRMQSFFVLGSAFLGGGEPRLGRDCFDESIGLAEEVQDLGAWVELAHLHAAASGSVFEYADATDLLRAALAILRAYGSLADDGGMQVDILMALALAHFMLEEFEPAREAVEEAREIVLPPRSGESHLATLDWIDALLYRWQAAPERALRLMLAAADRYADDGTQHRRLQLARLYTDVVECALDLAELFPTGASRLARSGLIGLAEPYVNRAVALAESVSDPATEGIALLASRRLRRLSRGGAGERRALEQLVRRASAERDIALLTRAHTAMGHELAWRGDEAAALAQFRTALDVLGPAEIPALGRWPRQALLAASAR